MGIDAWSAARRGCALLVLGCFVSCGGGGGGSGGSSPPPQQPQPQPEPQPPAGPSLALTEVAQVDNAVYLTAPPGDARQFIVDRRGRVLIRENGTLRTTPFLDIGPRTSTSGEGGLLSLAFDPDYATNGRVVIVYVGLDNVINVDRLTVGASPDAVDPASRLTILRIPHPDFDNHYGGQLAFGPDGMLYLSTGDGGSAGDPRGNARNPQSLLGKLLRIDVRATTAAEPYRIPADNPFAGMAGRRGEIWALGLRNPWRFGFDGSLLYVADVGQAQREEVDIADAGAAGLDYGWNVMEGSACYNAATCDKTGLTLPVGEYEHGANDANGCAITGGYVYRGGRMPALAGSYLFSDYCGGYLKSFHYTGNGSGSGSGSGSAPAVTTWRIPTVGGVVSFGRDGSGELYVIASSGRIYRIDGGATGN